MNTLIAVGHFNGDKRGGASRIAWDCALELHKRGHDVVLLCEAVKDGPQPEFVDGIRLLRYQTSAGRNPYQRHRKAAIAQLRDHLKTWKPDFIWGHAPFQFLAATDLFPDVRAAYVVHSPLPLEILQRGANPDLSLRIKSWIGRRIERTCLNRARTVQVLSRYTAELLHSLYGSVFSSTLEGKIRITPGWTDTDRFYPHSTSDRSRLRRELGWPIDRPVLFTLRRLVPRMGLDRLIDAAAMLRERGHDFDLYIGGEGELHPQLEHQIQSLGLTDRVSLLGGIPEAQLADCYAASVAFVIPTTALECFGLIAVEALAAGIPVLSTPVGALPEIIASIEPRWLARDNSAQALANLMTAFLRGLLPRHTAQELHAFAVERYSQHKALPTFCDSALQDQDEES